MLILVGLCVGLFLWTQEGDETQERSASTLLDSFLPEDVSGLTATGQDGRLELRRNPDDSERWDVRAGQEWGRADAIRVDEILGALRRTEVRDSFPLAEVTPDDLSTYGLTAPATEIELQVPGSTLKARFGKRSLEGGAVYTDRGKGTDVMVASATAFDEILQAIRDGLRDKRVSDLRTYDVKGIEIEQGGVTTLQAEKDLTQIWRVTQPFAGYADPLTFETRVSNIVNEQWLRLVEDGVQDLARYGLAQPAARISLISKRDVRRTYLLGGAAGDDGSRFVVEEGFHSVFTVSKRFADAVLADAADIRDRSFARLGFGIESVTVNVDETSWVLRKAHADWEVEKPAREPAEEPEVESYLEQLRQWPIVEFLDGEEPSDYGISEDGDQIQIGTEGGAVTTLLIGKERADGNRYAQRLGDGGVVVVLGAPVQRALQGWLQFKRRRALELPLDDIDFIGRETGFGDDGAKVTEEKWRRDLDGADKSWRAGIGRVGAGLDADAMTAFLDAIHSIQALDWHHANSHLQEGMGFHKDGGTAATTWIEIGFRSDIPDRWLEIGHKLPDRDAYYAHVRGSHFVFEMSGDDVRRLTAPLTKPE
jgi:hypothetical protein